MAAEAHRAFPATALSLSFSSVFASVSRTYTYPPSSPLSPGGLQAGSSSLGLGLGGGWTIAPGHMTVGVGAGLPRVNASVALTLDYDGAAEFKITTSGPLTCTPSRDAAGANVMTCKSG